MGGIMAKNQFSKFILLAMASGLLLVSLLFFVSNEPELSQQLAAWPAWASSRVSRVFRLPVEWFSGLSADIENLLSTYEENKTLKRRLVTLENQERLIKELEADNQVLRQALGLSERFASSRLLEAKVIRRSTVAWLDQLTLDKGLTASVTEDMVLMTDEGVVGLVTQVFEGTSQVVLLTNSVVQRPLAVKISSGSTWVYGLLLGYDKDKKVLKIGQFNRQEGLSEGAAVVTSGLDGETLAELPIGQVQSLERAGDQSLVAYVRLTADLEELDTVHLIGRGAP